MRITWAEFVECSKRHSCPNCEIGEPEKCWDECMECFAAYVEWTVRKPVGKFECPEISLKVGGTDPE